MLRVLWEEDGAPKLDHIVPRLTSIRPRTVTATREEIDALMQQASPTLRLLLLMCSDLAIRSGTAVELRPHNYDPHRRELRFRTKYDEKVGLPVTDELADALESLDLTSREPFITQQRRRDQPQHQHHRQHEVVDAHRLRAELATLRKELGINKRIVPHDLRRTAAVQLYRHTKNIRTVQSMLGHRNLQSTFWYLDHDLEPIDRADLEAIKRPFIVPPRKEHTA